MKSLSIDKELEKIAKFKVGAILSEMGTGKTKVAINIINSKIDKINKVYWICPKGLIENKTIEKECKKWGAKFTPIMISFGILSIYNHPTFLWLYGVLQPNDYIVCDESLLIKNNDATRTKQLLLLSELVEYKLILNGTPISKNILDVHSQFQFLDKRILNNSYEGFLKTYCKFWKNNKQVIGYENLEHLYTRINPFVYQKFLKIDVKKQYFNLSYSLNSWEKEEYKLAKEEWKENYINNNISILGLLQHLQWIYATSIPRLEQIKEFIGKDKYVIFYKFKKEYEFLKELEKQGCILLNIQSTQVFGLNLQEEFNKVIFTSKSWDLSLMEQAEKRIYRQGQDKTCLYYYFNVDVGLENMIKNCLDKKQDLLKNVVENLENL